MTGQPLQVIAIGASAGAVHALSVILPALPAGYALPVLIVVHVPADRDNPLVSLFRDKCRLPVGEAGDKETIRPGSIYFAPADYHLLVEADHTLSLSWDEPVLFSRPSIDVLFESVADAYGEGVVGVILTGANEDGARGLKAIVEAGGVALVEDPMVAYASAMPAAALAECPGARSMSLEAIADYLATLGAAA